MSLDFDKMSLKEMQEVKVRLDRAINSYEDRKRREALAAVEQAAREHGFNLAELTGVKTPRTGTVAPKYANPDDPTMTWSGRGRKPRWIVAHLEDGKELDDMLI